MKSPKSPKSPSKKDQKSEPKSWIRCFLFLIPFLGGGFKYFLFSPQLGEDSHFD